MKTSTSWERPKLEDYTSVQKFLSFCYYVHVLAHVVRLPRDRTQAANMLILAPEEVASNSGCERLILTAFVRRLLAQMHNHLKSYTAKRI